MTAPDTERIQRLGCTCGWLHDEGYAILDPSCPLHSKERQLPLQYDWDKAIKPDARYGGEWMPSGNSELGLTLAPIANTAVDNVTVPEGGVTTTYDPTEQDVLSRVFTDMLRSVTKDGGHKRARGEKPPWWNDSSHEAAMYRHLEAYETGESFDPDSGAHPLIGMAWRGLAIAYKQTYGNIDPNERTQ